jgi:general secretion pathway protein E
MSAAGPPQSANSAPAGGSAAAKSQAWGDHISARIPYAFSRAHGVLAWRNEGDAVVVLLRPDATVDGIAELRRVLNRPLVTRNVEAEMFAAELSRAYNQAGAALAMSESLANEADLSRLMQEMPTSDDLLDGSTQAPVIRMINALLLQALRERASDLHFEPYEARAVVRFRIDGMLRDAIEPPRALHGALVSRLKIMAGLDIAEKRLPQDGRIALKLGDRQVDVRVSTLPTGAGERVVLRLLDQEAARLDLTTLGMRDDTLRAIDRLIREPHGILLVTGPTGSGKTTTLYAALSRLPRDTTNMMTVEDPIEYALDGVAQTQVNARIELTFARALRSILRQDPDVIMIGEIRDLETAQIAVQASLTGHLVLATLHTNDAASAITRLADMGVEPYLLASSLLGVLAQRLVRTLCPACRVAAAPSEGEARLLADLGLPSTQPVWAAPGCDACNQSGFSGRTGVYELLRIDEPLRRMVHDVAGELALRDAALRAGMRRLRDDGARFLVEGRTSLAELTRVTRES